MGNKRTRRNTHVQPSTLSQTIHRNTRKLKKEYEQPTSSEPIQSITKPSIQPNTISIPEDIQKIIERNEQLIIDAYNERTKLQQKLKLPKRPPHIYSEGFIRRMSEPIFFKDEY